MTRHCGHWCRDSRMVSCSDIVKLSRLFAIFHQRRDIHNRLRLTAKDIMIDDDVLYCIADDNNNAVATISAVVCVLKAIGALQH